MPSEFVCSYASRDPARAAEYQQRHGGLQHYTGYDEALRDPTVDAVVVAVRSIAIPTANTAGIYNC